MLLSYSKPQTKHGSLVKVQEDRDKVWKGAAPQRAPSSEAKEKEKPKLERIYQRTAKLSTQESQGMRAPFLPNHSFSYILPVCHQLCGWHKKPQLNHIMTSQQKSTCTVTASLTIPSTQVPSTTHSGIIVTCCKRIWRNFGPRFRLVAAHVPRAPRQLWRYDNHTHTNCLRSLPRIPKTQFL